MEVSRFFLSAFQSTPSQNIVKRSNQQLQSTAPRNSNLRELPIAPSHAMEMSNNRRNSTPAAQVKPITSTMSATKSVTGGGNSQGRPEMKAKAITPVGPAKSEGKSEPEVRDFFCLNKRPKTKQRVTKVLPLKNFLVYELKAHLMYYSPIFFWCH